VVGLADASGRTAGDAAWATGWDQDRDLDAALDAARCGDEAGMADLWRALNPLVLRYLRVVVGQAAEDVASESWLQAAREVRQFRGDAAGFRVWLFRVARHRALDELRRSRRRPEDPAGLYAAEDRAGPDDPAGEVFERMATERALSLIAALPRNQAEAVMLRAVLGLEVAQAAEILGKRPGAIRVAAMRGLRKLGEVLEAERRGPVPVAREVVE
jgi:RNA polymerase sigma-70 factor (ECF subfamily)